MEHALKDRKNIALIRKLRIVSLCLTVVLGNIYAIFWLWIIPRTLALKAFLVFAIADALSLYIAASRIRTILSENKTIEDTKGINSKSRLVLNFVAVLLFFSLVMFGSKVRSYMLETACLSGRMDAVRILILDMHTSVNAGFDNNTPLMIAASTGNLDLTRFLLKQGAEVSLKNKQGETALSISKLNSVPGVEELLENYSSRRSNKLSR